MVTVVVDFCGFFFCCCYWHAHDADFIEQSSFLVIHKIVKVGILLLLKIKNHLDTGISHFQLNEMHHGKYNLKLIQL